MFQNYLKLNASKTELLLIGSRRQLASVDASWSISFGGSTIYPSKTVKNLGFNFASDLSLTKQVKEVCAKSYASLRNIARIRHSLSPQACETLIHAFITSKLDCCNGMLFGAPQQLVSKLQRIQNSAARLLSNTRISQHVTPILKELHWLPVLARIEYKILLVTFKIVRDLSPAYLRECMLDYRPSRSLRSVSQCLLVEPRVKSRIGKQRLGFAGPYLFNRLPLELRLSDSIAAFKQRLKTHLFEQHFSS